MDPRGCGKIKMAPCVLKEFVKVSIAQVGSKSVGRMDPQTTTGWMSSTKMCGRRMAPCLTVDSCLSWIQPEPTRRCSLNRVTCQGDVRGPFCPDSSFLPYLHLLVMSLTACLMQKAPPPMLISGTVEAEA